MASGSRGEPAWSIRAAAPGDAPAIAALIASYEGDLVLDRAQAAPYLASVSEEAERGYLASPRYRYVVAEVDAGPEGGSPGLAGFIAMRDTTHLFHLFVERAWHRRGLARALWARVLQEAGDLQPPPRRTVNASLSAVPVYRALGFAETGPVTHVHGIALVPMATQADPPASADPAGADRS